MLRYIGDVFQRRDNPALALWFYRQSAGLNPGDDEAEYAAAKAWRAQGALSQAEAVVHTLLRRSPSHLAGRNLLGAIQLEAGELIEAEATLRKALELNERFAPAWNNLGSVHAAQDRLSEAEQMYRRALFCDRSYLEALVNLGMVLNRMARYDEAEVMCRRALEIQPDYAGAHNNLANVLLNLNRHGEAERHYREAIALQPNLPEAHINLALALGEPAYLVGAIDFYEKLLERQPRSFLAHIRLGLGYFSLNEFEKAQHHFQIAADISPESSEPPARLGDCHARQALLDDALEWYERAISIAEQQREVISGDIRMLHPDWSLERSRAAAAVPQAGFASCLLFTRHYADRPSGVDLRREAEAWAHLVRGGTNAIIAASHANDRDPNRRLRVGYVSRDFGNHSVAYFLEPLLAAHDHHAYEIFGYCNLQRPDDMTEKLQALCDGWRDIHALAEDEVVALIKQDCIDILVDLSGHSGGNRLRVFLERPAPVQVTYLGYPGTTGLAEIGYRLTDAIADPLDISEADSVEQLVRLPGCFLCYQPAPWTPKVKPSPAVERGYITFGSFNNIIKVTDEVVASWAKILSQVEGGRLMLKGQAFASARATQHYRGLFAKYGISSDRLELMGWNPEGVAHLDLYGEVDIALDPFPYNGTTTTCEALWMGVPVITLRGRRHSARVGASLLTAIGHEELIANSPTEYIDIAVALAADLSRLAQLRLSLRTRMSNSRLVDRVAHARGVESAYREMWARWCVSVEGNIAS